MHEFDFLITKEKLEKDVDDFKDFLNPNTRAVTVAIAEPAVRSVQKGVTIQFLRRGYFHVDRPHLSPAAPMELFMVPDGKANAMSTLSTKLAHR